MRNSEFTPNSPRYLTAGLVFVIVLVYTTLGIDLSMASAGERQEGSSAVLQAEQSGKSNGRGPHNDRNPSEVFSEEVGERIIQQVADGLQQHNTRRLLSAFDSELMVGYANFQNQVEAMFQQYDSFRVYFRLAQITSEAEVGIALVEFELEEIPRSQDARPVRKTEQVRFELRRGKNGWKIVEVKPRAFFS